MFTRTAQFYDAIYETAGKDYRSEAGRLHEVIQAHKRSEGNTLLDVACGTGVHLEHLQTWYQVEGLDLDEGMLAVARERLPDVPLHQGDMVDFDLGRQFDAVVCLFSSIGYAQKVPGLQRAVACMRRHLVPGGVLAFEPWIRPEDWHTGRPHALLVDQPELKIARANVSRQQGRLSIVDFHYLVATPAGVEHFTELHELYLFDDQEYQEAIEAAGLVPVYLPEGLNGRGLYLAVAPP
jgi:SAM-dependent methyltransferase